jgi:RND family efflux transporter MFP subunit
MNSKKKNRALPVIAILLLIAAAAGTWFLFLKPADPAASAENDSTITTVTRRDIESRLLLSGEVTPAFLVEVKSEVGGKAKTIHVEAGQTVKKGDLLATIDDTDLLTEKKAAETEIEGAQLSVDKNRGNYERAKALYEEKLISKEVYANLEADLRISENSFEKAQSRLQTVEDRLKKTRITAPADGTVLDIPITEGQVVVAAASVNSGTVVMKFADLSQLLIDTHVNQVDVPKVMPGQRVLVNMQGDNSDPVGATVEFVAPLATVKNNIKGFAVQAAIDPGDARLKPGMSVSMTLPVAEAKAAVSVPIAAVFDEDEERVVFVKSGETTEKRKVTIGVTNLRFAEITSGLAEGEQVLIRDPRTTNQG